MTIWTYAGNSTLVDREVVSRNSCLYCQSSLNVLPEIYEGDEHIGDEALSRVAACPVCGWWTAIKVIVRGYHADHYKGQHLFARGTRWHHIYGAAGSLRELDVEDISQPIGEVRRYLAAKYQARFKLHPRLFEETVASVFKDLGHQVVVTAYSADDGIDIILEGTNRTTIGVQVKRYKNSISVEQIRSLAGALILGGHTRGVFVTTSTYQTGVSRTAARFGARGYPIELIDASKFFTALCIAQRHAYEKANDKLAPFFNFDQRLMTFIGIGGL